MGTIVPFSPRWFRRRRIFRSPAYFQSVIQEALDGDPVVAGGGRVSADASSSGPLRAPTLRLYGTVRTEATRARAVDIARTLCQEIVEMADDISVVADSPVARRRGDGAA